ncbi:uncharacterized protein VICG_01651 [Vittaforma corneae ATCC 50505]|uniref:30S ribosomal protein S28e n=1 Tax=Vittaforma corneae (strain ATCC 50505) TaxID=993615 RepID=L2GK71_VITCO|nr:uncharacterized protein VICG_01651 [Vittaforma corneae ATCC 50505]ELA41278.1 hypothetical protein VICG_01651 [Vittaforma corneae ATCC 50505]
MATKKVETAQETTQPTQNLQDDSKVYIAQVLNVYGRTGSGGDVNICKVLVRDTGKTIFRSVQGPVDVGHLLALRECVRESRRSR